MLEEDGEKPGDGIGRPGPGAPGSLPHDNHSFPPGSRSGDSRPSDSHPSDGCRGADPGTGLPGIAGAGRPVEISLDELVLALADAQPGGARALGSDADQEEVAADILAARERGDCLPLTAGQLARLVAGHLPAGPTLTAILAAAAPEELEYADLPAVAEAYRRQGAWAHAGELGAVAQIAALSAAADPRAAVSEAGEPRTITRSAAGEISLACVLSHHGAQAWAQLGVSLRWQLAATGAALAAGDIDLTRARMITSAADVLDDETARRVEAAVLPRAGEQTYGQLRAALARAVISADPRGAEIRRLEAEQRAAVRLYPAEDGTATLTGSGLPAIQAAAAMARIAAIARAWKAAGAAGAADLLRANVYLRLLLGTMPQIGPPLDPGAPGPHDPPVRPSSGPGRPPAPGRHGPGRPDLPERPEPGERAGPVSSDGPVDDLGPWPADPDPSPRPADPDPSPRPADDPDPWPADGGDPGPGDDDAPPDDGLDIRPGPYWPAPREDDKQVTAGPAPAWPAIEPALPAGIVPPPTSGPAGGMLDLTLPWPALTGDSPEPGHLARIGPITGPQARHLAWLAALGPRTSWRIILISSRGEALATARVHRRRTQGCQEPPPSAKSPPESVNGPPAPDGPPAAGSLLASSSPPASSRSSVTNRSSEPGGVAAITGSLPDGQPSWADDGFPAAMPVAAVHTNLIGRVTVIVSRDDLLATSGEPDSETAGLAGHGAVPSTLRAVLRAARRAAARADDRARADGVHSEPSCAHHGASSAYRPPATLREHVIARDRTCRSPRCRQPARYTDLDHTVAYALGGKTCHCNLGALCRTHHQLKQAEGWLLQQSASGRFVWTTPAGRAYAAEPDTYLA